MWRHGGRGGVQRGRGRRAQQARQCRHVDHWHRTARPLCAPSVAVHVGDDGAFCYLSNVTVTLGVGVCTASVVQGECLLGDGRVASRGNGKGRARANSRVRGRATAGAALAGTASAVVPTPVMRTMARAGQQDERAQPGCLALHIARGSHHCPRGPPSVRAGEAEAGGSSGRWCGGLGSGSEEGQAGGSSFRS